MGLCGTKESNTVAPAPPDDAKDGNARSQPAGAAAAKPARGGSGSGGAAASASGASGAAAATATAAGTAADEKLVYRVNSEEANGMRMAGSQLMRTQYTEQRVKRTSTKKTLGSVGSRGSDVDSEYSQASRQRVFRAFRSNPLFAHLNEQMLEKVFEEMVPLSVDAQTVIFNEGEEANMFYVVDEGLFAAGDANGRKLDEFKQGDAIGEEALLAKVRTSRGVHPPGSRRGGSRARNTRGNPATPLTHAPPLLAWLSP